MCEGGGGVGGLAAAALTSAAAMHARPARLLPSLVTYFPPPACVRACMQVGYIWFRLHPKGVGLVCERAGGLPPLTFVEEYLGEIHTPWRWFEIQARRSRRWGVCV